MQISPVYVVESLFTQISTMEAASAKLAQKSHNNHIHRKYTMLKYTEIFLWNSSRNFYLLIKTEVRIRYIYLAVCLFCPQAAYKMFS